MVNAGLLRSLLLKVTVAETLVYICQSCIFVTFLWYTVYFPQRLIVFVSQ